MKCPECMTDNLYTVDSRPHGEVIKRRKECGCCKERFNTYESRMYLDEDCFPVLLNALEQYKSDNKSILDKELKALNKMITSLKYY